MMVRGAEDHGEGRTKVVAFRVPWELYEEVEKIKAETGLSLVDLVKLGAGIAREEVRSKLAELSGLKTKLLGVRDAICREENKLNDFIKCERECRLGALSDEIAAYKLFSLEWSVEMVGYKLRLPLATVHRYFEGWVEHWRDEEVLERGLLRECLKKHVDSLKNELQWGGIIKPLPDERVEELRKGVKECWRLLSSPERIRRKDKEFLIATYSSKVLAAPRREGG